MFVEHIALADFILLNIWSVLVFRWEAQAVCPSVLCVWKTKRTVSVQLPTLHPQHASAQTVDPSDVPLRSGVCLCLTRTPGYDKCFPVCTVHFSDERSELFFAWRCVCWSTCVCVCGRACMRVFVSLSLSHTHIHTYARTQACTHTHTLHARLHARTQACTHAHTHRHLHMQLFWLQKSLIYTT